MTQEMKGRSAEDFFGWKRNTEKSSLSSSSIYIEILMATEFQVLMITNLNIYIHINIQSASQCIEINASNNF